MRPDKSNPGFRIRPVPRTALRRPWNRCFLAILLSTLAGVSELEAQETNILAQTNGITSSEDLAGADVAQAGNLVPDEEATGTNTVAETNQTANPGPDARARRLRRQRRTPSFGNSQTNGFGQSDSTGTNAAAAALDYTAFRLVVDRNIFDPNRSPRSTVAAARPKTVESFTLVGTMSYEKGVFAFFDGTSSDYKKVAKPEDAIAGYKVMTISPDSVKLLLNTNTLELRVGTQMRRREDGTWEHSAEPAPSADTASASAHTESPAGGAESDIIKKMMQRREKE